MGNVSSVGEGGEEGEIGGDGGQDLMGQSPPQSPRRAAQSPLLFTQNPMVPLQRPDEIYSRSDAWMHNITQYDDIMHEEGIPTMITWSHGGKEVFLDGSWDNWSTKKALQKSGKDFIIMKVLPSGVYHYRFIVDGEWRYASELPWGQDEFGNAYNILDLQDLVPEEIRSIANFEPPPSPDSSYNNWTLDAEDFSKEPPSVPPQLGSILLNSPSSAESSSLSRPQHVVLNHLFIQKGKSRVPVVALGTTHRFRAKYVTVVLYKSSQR